MTQKEKTDELLPVYLVNGEDELKRETVIKRLKARIAHVGDLTLNSDEFSGEGVRGQDIVSACNTLPFSGNMRLVLVTRADKLKKADAEALADYLASPSESTVLALVAEKLPKNSKLYKTVASFGNTAIIDCTPLKRNELAKAVRSMASGHGITMTDGAIRMLLERVGENTVRIDSELKKIALDHRGSDAVSDHEVAAAVARTAEVKPWEFVDAFSARNISKCLLYLQRMDSVSPHALIAMCTSRIRELICARSLYERGDAHTLAATLGMPDWRVKNHIPWAKKFTADELRNALISAVRTEKAMKSGADPDTAFLEWVLATTVKHT